MKILKNSFNQIDTDNDGSLSKEEIEKAGALTKGAFGADSKWETILSKCDLDGNGKIDFQEFFTAAIDH